MEQLHQPAPDVGVVAVALVGADVGPPQRLHAAGLGPHPHQVVIVRGEHDPATRPDRAHHLPHDRERIGHVLEHEAGVGEVEAAPLLRRERRGEHVALPQLDQMLLAGLPRQASRLGDLFGAALDPDRAASGSGGARHVARELGEPAAEVEDALAPRERQLAQAGGVE